MAANDIVTQAEMKIFRLEVANAVRKIVIAMTSLMLVQLASAERDSAMLEKERAEFFDALQALLSMSERIGDKT